ncbi:MAG TPA: hypothetical protein VFN67_39735 [Polyangiales bacterium]|nr:hypothetical protein [Polyangiales bacterium]
MKGWLIFAGIFLVGIALIVSAIVYVVLTGGAEGVDLPPRILSLSGIILIFGAIYGSAFWRFRIWMRTRDDQPPDKR